MNKHFIISVLFLAHACLLVGCSDNDSSGAGPGPDGKLRIPVTLSGVKTRVALDPGSDGEGTFYTPRWESGDKLAVFTVGAATNSNEPFSVLDIGADGTAGRFSGELEVDPAGGSYTLYALHPWSGEADSNMDIAACKALIPAEQSPSKTSIDTRAYLSVAAPMIRSLPAAASGIEVNGLMLKRLTAPVVLNISFDETAEGTTIALPEGEKVEKVVLTVNDNSCILAGDVLVNLETGEFGKFENGVNSVAAVYDADAGVTMDDLTVWLMVNPGTIVAGAGFSVDVYTENYIFSRDLTAPAEGITFDPDTATRLDVTMREWADVSSAYADMPGVELPEHMKILRTRTLHGRKGNTGYVIKIPAGKVDMKTVYETKPTQTWFDDQLYTPDVIGANSDYRLFVTGSDTRRLKPLVRSLVINNGALADNGAYGKAEPAFHWSGKKYYTSPPTLGIKEGKAAISYADMLDDGKLYRFSPPQHALDTKNGFTGGILWNVDAAVSGYAMPLKNGEVQIRNESADDYKALADLERNHPMAGTTVTKMVCQNTKILLTGASEATLPDAWVIDGERMARTMLGVTPEGDLLIFVSERHSGVNNALKSASDLSDGSTLQEAAVTLKEFGCSDAMAVQYIQYASVSLQNGVTGQMLTRTHEPVDENDKSLNFKSSSVIMFK